MREKYIRSVKRALSAPRKIKNEVVRDLNEVFDSALEHGETEADVIERLGTPERFALETEEQLGFERSRRRKTGLMFAVMVVFQAVAAVSLGLYVSARQQMDAALAIIGGADGPTAILVNGPSVNLPLILLIVGIGAVCAAVVLAVRLISRSKKAR